MQPSGALVANEAVSSSERVSDPADGLDKSVIFVAIHLDSQIRNIRLDAAQTHVTLESPHNFQQLLARENLTG